MTSGSGALRCMIESRDFGLDDRSRRISELEKSQSQPTVCASGRPAP
jgi:hypothetical protein